MTLDSHELAELFQRKYAASPVLGWGPAMCQSFGYFNPDDVYEATVSRLVTPETAWLDVGCGRDIFPSNRATAGLLAKRCRLLVGLDPSDNVRQNQFVHERHQMMIEDFQPRTQFDVVTLRMVAEHIANPDEAVRALGRLTRPGGRVVIYTVYRWAPITVLSDLVPFAFHHKIKRLFWDGGAEDTFPTTYLMNTRTDLAKYFSANGFSEESFQYCDDCRTMARWRFMSRLELTLWKCFNKLHLHYPEVCILAVYRRV